jgi:hypothetical protein
MKLHCHCTIKKPAFPEFHILIQETKFSNFWARNLQRMKIIIEHKKGHEWRYLITDLHTE